MRQKKGGEEDGQETGQGVDNVCWPRVPVGISCA